MVPVNEGFATEQGIELFADSFKQFLNSSWVSKEGHWHLDSPWRDVADAGFYIIWDPLHKGVTVLDIETLLINFFGWHLAAELGRSGEVATVSGVRCAHHVFGIKDLRHKLRNGLCSLLARATRGERCKSSQQEVVAGKWYQVYG
jgi:hypothetical protein